MKVTNDLLLELTQRVDEAVDSLMAKLAAQEKIIANLKEENKQLKSHYTQILIEIEQYVTQLEQIKSHYVDSNHNNK